MSKDNTKSDWPAILFLLIGLPVAFTYGGLWLGLLVLVIGSVALGWGKRHESPHPIYKERTKEKPNMANNIEIKIRIHPPGTRTTDPEVVERLSLLSPASLQIAQNIVRNAEVYLKSTNSSDDRWTLEMLKSQCKKLPQILKQEGAINEELAQKGDAYLLK